MREQYERLKVRDVQVACSGQGVRDVLERGIREEEARSLGEAWRNLEGRVEDACLEQVDSRAASVGGNLVEGSLDRHLWEVAGLGTAYLRFIYYKLYYY